MKKVISQDTYPAQNNILLHKKIPKHRRPRFEIETKEALYKKVNAKRDQGQRLFFNPFAYSREIGNEEEVRHIRRLIKTSSKVAKSFKFDLDINQNLNNKMFAQISQEVKKTQGLKVLDFYISGGEEFGDLALKNLGIGFKYLKYLQYLKLRIVDCYELKNEGPANIGRALRRLISLETFDLSIEDGGQIDDEGVRNLFKGFKYLRGLKTLNLGFHYLVGSRTYEEIGNVQRVFQGLKSLKEINMNFFSTEFMTFEGFENITGILKALPKLEIINLRLTECNLEDEWLKILIEGFEGKSHLKKINLDIGRNYKLTNSGLDSLKECFKELSAVEEIIIDIEGCEEVTEEGREVLREGLQGISSLKNLEIKLE